MTARIVLSTLIALVVSNVVALAQTAATDLVAQRYVDSVTGLSLDDTIARAVAQEPGLRSSRSQVDIARGNLLQAALRPNPSVSFEQRVEPGGSDRLTSIGVEWPLELFRRGPRVVLADRQVGVANLAVTDRERLLAAEVRARYGDVLIAIRNLHLVEDLVATTRRQYELLRSRVEQGATPPLERDLVHVELFRLEADRLLEMGRAEAALAALKRVIGMMSHDTFKVRDTLEDVVRQESASSRGSPDASQVLDQRSDVRAAAARVDAGQAEIARAQADGRFDVSLFGSFMRMDAGFPQRGFAPDGSLDRVRGIFNYASVGAMITVPIFNQNQGDVAAARAARAGAEAAYQATRVAADTELAAARSLDEHAARAVEMYVSGARSLARQNRTVVAQSYELGRVTVFDVIAEQRRYLDVERAFTETLRVAYEARTALNLALGGVR